MADERRSTSRILTSGVRVVYELATGERVDAAAEDLSSTGLFVQTVRNIAVGKRIALEIRLPGEPEAWSAVGRVVWVRGAAETATAGMGVKFIDIDEAACDAFEKLRAAGAPPAIEDGAAAIDLARSTVPFKLSNRKLPPLASPPPSHQHPATRPVSRMNWVAVLAVAALAAVSVYVVLSRTRSATRHEAMASAESAVATVTPPAPPAAPLPAASILDAPPARLAPGAPASAPGPVVASPSEPAHSAMNPSDAMPARTAPRASGSANMARPPSRGAEDSTNPY
ncbi:MAG: PilZ domain-containing protein [Polyangiaceae bacterium]|jgi:uncharacterized protein (TIGR02266 family)